MSKYIVIGTSPTLHIRGVIAHSDIQKDTIIEECPIILYPVSQEKLIEATTLGNYIFEWDKKSDCFVLGYGALYNHSYHPNARYQRDYKNKIMRYIAIEDISKGEEVFVNYNGKPECQDPIDKDYLLFDSFFETNTDASAEE